MNGENYPYRQMLLLAATLALFAVFAGTVPAAAAPIVEIVPLEKDHWVLVLPGGATEEPLEVEIRKEGAVFRGWGRSGPTLNNFEAARWTKAWQEILGAEVQQQDLWSKAMDLVGKESLSPGLAIVEPDLRLILRNSGDNPIYLSLIESHAVRHDSAGWEKVGDIKIDSILSVPPNNRKVVWNLLFGQDPPASNAWPAFWSSWIDSARKDPGKRLLLYRRADGSLVRVVRERIEEALWQQLVAGSYTPPVELSPPPPTPPATTPPPPPESYWRQYMPYLGILSLIFAALAALRYRAQIAKHLLTWLAKRLSSSQGHPSLGELIEKLYATALEGLKQDPMPDPELEVRPQALAFARKRMLAVAEAGTVALPLFQPPQEDDKTAARQEEEADLGRELLKALREHGRKASTPHAREFLASLLELEGQLTSEKQTTDQLRDDRQRHERQIRDLVTSAQSLQKENDSLFGQVGEERRRFKDLETALKRQKIDHDEDTRSLRAENTALKREQKDLETTLASEKRLRTDLQEKSRTWATERGQFEAALAASRLKHDQLNTRLATVTDEKNASEVRANRLQAQIEQERRDQETARTDTRVLGEKLTRIRLADDYLRKTHLAYWDRCQHPASAAALLYNGYLGLYQIVSAAARREPLLEAAGWINLRNLMRRVGQVPGLERWEKGFGRGVYPDIDAVQIPESQIVDRNLQDKERFLQKTVLRNLLSGDLQLGGATGERVDLEKLLGWPVFFKVEDDRVWGAS